MLYPICRIVTPQGMSSGVFVSETHILTVFHALKEAITVIGMPGCVKEVRHAITCEIFPTTKAGKKPTQHMADIFAYDEAQDIALLQLKKGKHKYAASLLPESKVKDLEIFDEVFAVGASLGHEPLPTKGMITYKKEELDFGLYWMTDAHILVGNSGGGVFAEVDGEYYLIGITTSMMVDDETDSTTHLTHFVPPQILHKFLKVLDIGKETE